jgi:cation diffusion facilitator family transporter
VRYNPEWYLADTIAAGFVSLFIASVSYKLIRSALYELADTAPDAEIMKNISTVAADVPGVLQAHDVKGRQSGPLLLIDLHIVVKSSISVHEGHEIAEAVKSAIIEEVGTVGEVLVHVEPEAELL